MENECVIDSSVHFNNLDRVDRSFVSRKSVLTRGKVPDILSSRPIKFGAYHSYNASISLAAGGMVSWAVPNIQNIYLRSILGCIEDQLNNLARILAIPSRDCSSGSCPFSLVVLCCERDRTCSRAHQGQQASLVGDRTSILWSVLTFYRH